MNRYRTPLPRLLRPFVPAVVGLSLLLVAGPAGAQEEEEDKPETGWSNETELSFVATQGNSDTQTFGLKSVTLRRWLEARYTLRLEAVRSNTAADRYAVADDSAPDGFVLVSPDPTRDVDRALVENTYHRQISERFGWNAGLTWDRNKDAGFTSRWVAFAGVGNLWYDREDLMFLTDYGVSYTSRDDITPDPDKDEEFWGIRLHWDYRNKLGKVTTLTHNFTVNTNISDLSDYYFDTTTGLAVSMNSHLALRVSVQFLYSNIPSLETIDLFLDPEQVVNVGSVDLPNEKLDTIFNTSLVISF
jgi:putative salt-induced outer membrane protein YdiY